MFGLRRVILAALVPDRLAQYQSPRFAENARLDLQQTKGGWITRVGLPSGARHRSVRLIELAPGMQWPMQSSAMRRARPIPMDLAATPRSPLGTARGSRLLFES